ncbi:MAG: (4Fe-4S)-binding protein, partial [Thermoplasmata archaeon]
MKEYEKTGVIALNEIRIPSEEQLKRGVAITECVQEIPCNPCVDACPVDAISMENINSPPFVDYDKCTG